MAPISMRPHSTIPDSLPGSPGSDADFVSRRRVLRRGMARSNTATVVALIISISFAAATVFYALETHQANQRTREELWNSQRAQATALRLSCKVGRRQEGLRAIAKAVRIRPSLELRDEAIATFPLVDVQPGSIWHHLPPGDTVLAFSCQHKAFAAGNDHGTISIRRMDDAGEIGRLEVSNRVMCLEFSPNGRWLAAHSEGGSIRLWDMTQQQLLLQKETGPGEFNEHSITFSPDSRQLVVCSPGHQVWLFATSTGQPEGILPVEAPPAVAQFDRAGRRLAIAAERRIHIWDLAERRRLHSLSASQRILDMAWHPVTRHFAVATPEGRIEMISEKGSILMELRGHTALVNRLLFDPGGTVLISTSWDGTTRFWSAHSGWPLLVSDAGFARQFDPLGTQLFYLKEGIGFGEWLFTSGTGFRNLALPRETVLKVFALDFSPDDRWLALAAMNGIHVVDCESGRPLGFLPLPYAGGVAFSEDGKSLLTSSLAGVHQIPCSFPGGDGSIDWGPLKPLVENASSPFQLGFVTRGVRHWFVARNNDQVALVDLARPNQARLWETKGNGPASSLAVNPEGRILVNSVWKGSGTRLWPLDQSGPARALGDEGGAASFSPDGRRLVVGTGRKFQIYETGSWRLEREIPRDTASALSGLVAFHPNGRMMAVTHTLYQIRLLDPETGQSLATLEAPIPARITALSFSRDGSQLAAATCDGAGQLWNLSQLQEELRRVGLDFNLGLASIPSRAGFPQALSWQSREVAVWLAILGSGLAFVFAFYSIRHHRRLVRAYEQIESVAEEHRRAAEMTQAHLVHSQKMKALGTLAAGIAHDFNNLLSIIRMSGQLVRRQLQPTGTARQNLQAIERAVGQGKRIVGSILGYTRHPSQPEQSFPMNAVINDTLAMLNAPYLGGLELALELDPKVPLIRGDKSRLEQVLLNLIVNAYEAMKGTGKLTIALRGVPALPACVLPPRPAPSLVELSLRDSGPGIHPEILPRIFEPFFTTKTGSGEHGTGLGLTTVYAIARQDGLGLAVESVLDQGTTFRVFIPAGGLGGEPPPWAPLAHGGQSQAAVKLPPDPKL